MNSGREVTWACIRLLLSKSLNPSSVWSVSWMLQAESSWQPAIPCCTLKEGPVENLSRSFPGASPISCPLMVAWLLLPSSQSAMAVGKQAQRELATPTRSGGASVSGVWQPLHPESLTQLVKDFNQRHLDWTVGPEAPLCA